MVLNGIKLVSMTLSGAENDVVGGKWYYIMLNGVHCVELCYIMLNGIKWCCMVLNGVEWR